MRNPEKRKQREEEWIAKLEIADGKGKYRRKGQDDIIWMSTSPTPAPLAPESVINVASSKDISNNIIELSLEAAQLEKSKKDVTSSFLPSPSRSPPPNKLIKGPSVINTPRLSGSSPTEDNNQNSESSSHRPEQQVVSNGGSIQVGNVSGADNAMSQFLQDAVVWFAKSSHCPRPLGQAHSTRTIPIGQRLNTLGSLLTACGWQGIDSSGACQWVRKGVIFVDDNETESTEWKSYLVPTLAEKRAAMVSYGTQEPPEHQPKPIWVFSSRVLGLPALGCLDIVESRAICKLG